MMEYKGVESEYTIGWKVNKEGEARDGHIWNKINIEGNDWWVDPTANKILKLDAEKNNIGHMYNILINP